MTDTQCVLFCTECLSSRLCVDVARCYYLYIYSHQKVHFIAKVGLTKKFLLL